MPSLPLPLAIVGSLILPHQPSCVDIVALHSNLRATVPDSCLSMKVDDCVLRREDAAITFLSGRIDFTASIDGEAVEAVFLGEGRFDLLPKDALERQQRRLQSGEEGVSQAFHRAHMVFTDSTFHQLRSQALLSPASVRDNTRAALTAFRDYHREHVFADHDARILADVAARGEIPFFRIYVEGPKDICLSYTIDCRRPEPVKLIHHQRSGRKGRVRTETWYSFPARNQHYKHRPWVETDSIHIKAQVARGGRIQVTADLYFMNLIPGMRMLPIVLSSSAGSMTVHLDGEEPCAVIRQEGRELWVVLPRALASNTAHRLRVGCIATEMVEDLGGGNYLVSARTTWHPRFDLHDPFRMAMKLITPPECTCLGTGRRLRHWTSPEGACSEWRSPIECLYAGFNLGNFDSTHQEGDGIDVACYTNRDLADHLDVIRDILKASPILRAALMVTPSELTTQTLNKNAGIEAWNAYRLNQHYFGPIPYAELAISQQPQGAFGQSWPGLVFLPFQAFFSSEVRDKLGFRRNQDDEAFFESVVSHEVAHQWWGHSVMFASYHDEWLAEGMAEYSAALYLLAAEGMDAFLDHLSGLGDHVLRGIGGDRCASDRGPLWMGRRLNTIDDPAAYLLIYSKGAYVLHMLRMILFDYDSMNDDRFAAMMTNFAQSFQGRVATTDDFKTVVERHCGVEMDWFFDQWVYGVEIPTYVFDYDLVDVDGGKCRLTARIRQLEVSSEFRMPVRLLVDFGGSYAVLSALVAGGDETQHEWVLPARPLGVTLNPLHEVLCEIRD